MLAAITQGFSLKWTATGLGMPYVDPETSLLMDLASPRGVAGLPLALIAVTARITERQDY